MGVRLNVITKTNKAVFLSWAYPPMPTPRAIQVARLALHLEHPVQVVCGADRNTSGGAARVDDAEHVNVTRLRRPGWRRYVDGALARTIPAALRLPDPYVDWAYVAARFVLRRVSFEPGDVLVTFGQPMSDHLAGLRIKRARRVPWIAHFSDPWTENPFVDRGPVTARLNERMERAVVEGADAVLFTSPETVDLVMPKYSAGCRSKVQVLPHAYDEKDYLSATNEHRRDTMTFRYLGNFYGHRTPQPLLDGLRRLASESPNVLSGLRIELVGAFEKGLKRRLDWAGVPEGIVQISPSVGYRQSLALMTGADGLLVIDAPAEFSVFLPSKLIDYVGSGASDFGNHPAGNVGTADQRTGGEVCDPSDPAAIAAGLRAMAERARAGGKSRPWGTPAVREEFRIEKVAAAMDGIIDKVAHAA